MASNEEIIIYPRRLMMFFYAAGSLVAVVVGTLFAVYQEEMGTPLLVLVVCYIGVPLLSYGFLWSVHRLLWPKPAVIISEQGILDDSTATGAGLVRWEDIAEIRPYRRFLHKCIGIVPRDTNALLSTQGFGQRVRMKVDMAMGYPPISIFEIALPVSEERLLLLIGNYHNNERRRAVRR